MPGPARMTRTRGHGILPSSTEETRQRDRHHPAQLEQGDSLTEIVEALLAARAALPVSAMADQAAPIAGRFIEALLHAIVWERLGCDHTDLTSIREAHARALVQGKPAEYVTSDGPLTVDERTALRTLFLAHKAEAA